jgi:hypothetical protein
MAPPLEVASPSGKSNMALLARFLPPELRKITPLLSETGVMFIAINQVRTDPGKMYGDPTSTPGGAAWKHFCSVMVHFLMSESKDSKIFDSADEQIGHTLKARIDKNRIGPPKRMCELDIAYVQGVINRHVEIAKLAVKYGVVKRPNNRIYMYGDDRIDGKDTYYETVLNNTWNQQELLEKVKEAKSQGMSETVVEQEEEDKNLWSVEE